MVTDNVEKIMKNSYIYKHFIIMLLGDMPSVSRYLNWYRYLRTENFYKNNWTFDKVTIKPDIEDTKHVWQVFQHNKTMVNEHILHNLRLFTVYKSCANIKMIQEDGFFKQTV